MKNILSLKNLSFKKKLMISYGFIILLPIFFIGLLLYNYIVETANAKAYSIIEQNLILDKKDIEKNLDDIENYAHQIVTQTSLENIFTKNYYSDIELVDIMNNRVSPMFSWYMSIKRSYTRGFQFFTNISQLPDGQFFHRMADFPDKKLLGKVINNIQSKGMFWEGIHAPREYLYAPSREGKLYSFFYSLSNVNRQMNSLLEVELDASTLFKPFTESAIAQSGVALAVCPAESEIIGQLPAAYNDLLSRSDFLGLITESANSGDYRVVDGKYYLWAIKVNRLNTFLVNIVPAKEFSKTFENSRNIFLLTFAAGILILLGLVYFVSELLLKKVKHAVKAVRKIQDGDFDVNIPVAGNDEIDVLLSDINYMSVKINDLINRVYKTEIAQKEAELASLQAQINPHFLYNTLETFKMMAEMNDDEKLSDGLTSLGNLMRYNISAGKKLVSIGNEIENVKDYIKIQNLILNDCLVVTFNIDEGLLQFKIPNLVFVPIVENSIIHGFKNRSALMVIEISMYLENETIYCIIKDNGTGISEERLCHIEAVLNGVSEIPLHKTKGSGIGLKNVNDRLKLTFGRDYGLNIQSRDGLGTTVIVKMPAQM